jgi:hypothetical protein
VVRFASRMRGVRARFAVGAAGALLLFAGLAIAPRSVAAAATLTIIDPSVFVRHGDAAYESAKNGMALRSGDWVRTDATGRALVTYADGSTVALDPLSEIQIVSVEMTGRNLIVLMVQTAGRAWYVLTNALSPNSRYEIRTPAAAAVIRAGSSLEVDVDADGATTFAVVEGEAVATTPNERIALSRGGSTRFTPRQPSPTPAATPTAPATASPSSPTNTPTASPAPTATPTASPAPLPTISALPLPTATPTPVPTPTVPPIVPIPTLPPLPGL